MSVNDLYEMKAFENWIVEDSFVIILTKVILGSSFEQYFTKDKNWNLRAKTYLVNGGFK